MTVVEQLVTAILDEDVEIDDALEAVIVADEQETAVSEIGIQLLTPDNESFIRLRAILALNQLKRPSAMPFLGNSLVNDPDPSVRRFCLGSLEQQDSTQAIPYFQQAIADEDADIRQAATVSLGVAVRHLVTPWPSDSERQEARVEILRQITTANLDMLLKQPITMQELGGIPVSEAAAMAFQRIGGAESVTCLCAYSGQLQHEVDTQEEDDEQAFRLADKSKLLRTIVTVLGDIGEADAIPCLSAVLQNSLDFRVRRLAASALGRMGHDACIPVLIDAFLRDRSTDVRKISRDSLAKMYPDWRQKAAVFIQKLRAGAEQRSQFDANGVITAVSPPDDEKPYQLTDFFIRQSIAHTDDDRLMALMAELVVTSADGSKTMAGERITAVSEQSNITEKQLQPLRVEIGGKALDPVLEQLQKNLEKYFQIPLHELNEETKAAWERTVSFANAGFIIRAIMSIALFAFGMYLMWDSYQQMKGGNLVMADFFGTGVPFLTGLATMIAMVYKGPLREIKDAVSDVGVANVAFIAYIHRVLQASHTFSHYYIKGEISFAELEKSVQSIDETMDDAVRVLRSLRKDAKADERDAVTTIPSPPDVDDLPAG